MDDLIQRPDLIHRLQQFLGLRQAAVVPRLLSGVQAVVIMGDVGEVATEKVITRDCVGTLDITGSVPGFHRRVSFSNPGGSGVVARLHEVEVGTEGLAVQPPLQIRCEQLSAPVGGTVQGEFRDLPPGNNPLAIGRPRPRVLLSSTSVDVFLSRHYVAYSPGIGRNWERGFTLVPNTQLVLEVVDSSGSGVRSDVSFLWTETREGQA